MHKVFISLGHESIVLVGLKSRNLPEVKLINKFKYRTVWWRFWLKLSHIFTSYTGQVHGIRWVAYTIFPFIASPHKFLYWLLGRENYDYPSTYHLLEHAEFIPDILHLHNLHGNYFDLRALPELSNSVPTVVTLHDSWLLAGHCAYFIDCNLWKTGCKKCPHLDYPPVLRHDNAGQNWQHKHDIYKDSRLFLVCPSKWLADQVRQSILMEGAKQLLVINNGVDMAVYNPKDKATVRNRLNWPNDVFIVMFAANSIHSIWKDYSTMREAILLVGQKFSNKPIHFYAIGEVAPSENIGAISIKFFPYTSSLAECYQAADVFLHAAKADTFPTTILEALACGKPVVATAVGGIPEQIINGETGFLVPAGDASALADKLICLIKSPELVDAMGEAAYLDAKKRFSIERMVSEYLQLYKKIV